MQAQTMCMHVGMRHGMMPRQDKIARSYPSSYQNLLVQERSFLCSLLVAISTNHLSEIIHAVNWTYRGVCKRGTNLLCYIEGVSH